MGDFLGFRTTLASSQGSRRRPCLAGELHIHAGVSLNEASQR
jgi:hypothetical protein